MIRPHALLRGTWRLTALALTTALAQPATLAGQRAATRDTAALQRLLVAEDSRGTGTDGITPLQAALSGGDTLLRRVAVRGLGRLQRPDLARQLLPLLGDPVAAIRSETANAIAQSLVRVRRGAASTDPTQLAIPDAVTSLIDALTRERDPSVAAAISEALGRLPLGDSAQARQVEAAIVARAPRAPGYLLVHGLYTLARARRFTGTLSEPGVTLLRASATGSNTADVRRLALLALAANGTLDSVTTLRASRDADAQVRRLALAGVRGLSPAERTDLVARAFADPSPIVRIAAVTAARSGPPAPDCSAIIHAVSDRDPYVALTAIDSLGAPCTDPASATATLGRILDGSLPTFTGPVDHRWQAKAHALRALARVDGARAAPRIAESAGSPNWGIRLAAASAATDARMPIILRQLAGDPDHNVREAAVTGLARILGHQADSVSIAALASDGYQVVLAAATALQGTRDPAALPAALDAFDRLSREQRENARDPRMMLLRRIAELGDATTAPRLRGYLADFDTLVAATVAATLSRWSGTAIAAHPAPLPLRVEPLGRILLQGRQRVRVTMAPSSGGGSFTAELFGDEAPASVARILRLAREHFYDGHVWQRVEPNFVIQGGGPDASEYRGDSTFMRDELTSRTHAIGTVGTSARGRDTGDAQWFVNLVDNPLLDHEYTVFGRIVDGLDVAEGVLEGDRIARIEVIGGN